MTEDQVITALKALENYGLLKLARPTGNYYQIHCPNRDGHGGGEDKKPSCGVLLHTMVSDGKTLPAGWTHCFSCGYRKMLPDVVTDILKYKNISSSGLEWLAQNVPGFDKSSVEFDYLIPPEMSEAITNKYAINYIMAQTGKQPQYVSEQELASYRLTVPYMYERRLTDEVIAKYDVGFDANFRPEGFKNVVPCITFPIKDIYGNVLGFCRRSIKGKQFFMDPGVRKSVYGLYELPNRVKSVIICESCFNCLTSVVYGKPAVATLGTGTEDMINQIMMIGADEYVLWFDNDAAGQKATNKFKKALSKVAIVSVAAPIPPIVNSETGESKPRDINDLEKKEFDELYSQRF